MIPLRYCKIQVTPPHNKNGRISSVFEAEIDHQLGLLKVEAGNLRGILIAVRVKP